MKERPRALNCRRRRRAGKLLTQPRPYRGQRAIEAGVFRRVLERGAFEEQAHRQVSAQGDREVSRRHAIGPLLDLTHDARPPAKRQ